MIDEWPMIENHPLLRHGLPQEDSTDQETVVVAPEDADEVYFDGPTRRTCAAAVRIISDKIRISREEKVMYDMVDGTRACAT